RGGNIQQLQAIQSVRIFREDYQIVRPMLIFNKKEIYDYAKQLGIKYYEDETNKSDDYQRNRLRHHIIPVLKAENPEFLKHVLEYTQQLTNNLQAIQEVADVKLNKISKEETLDYDKFVKESPLWQRILLERYLEVKGLEIKETQVQQILAMLNDEKKPQAKFDLNEKFEFYHEYLEIGIRIKSTTSLNLEENFELKLNQWHNLEEGKKIGLFKIDEIEPMPGDETLVVEDNENWVIRHRQPGDSLKMSFGNQKIKKVFIDKKIPSEQRNKSWLITKNKNEVYWILETKKNDLSMAPQNAKITKKIRKTITNAFESTMSLVVYVLQGAVMFTTDIIRKIDTSLELDFMDVSSYGEGTESSGEVKIIKDLDTSVTGRDVLIVEG